MGLGEEELSPDVQISRVEMPRTVLVGTSLVVDVIVSHRGYSGRTVQLVVEDTGQLLASEDVTFARDGEPVVARVRIEAQDAGPRLLRFRVSAQEGERVTENNVRDVLVNVVNNAEKILYFEGEPRWEVKFLRRAVSEDENLQVVVLQRTAESKFLRLDVDDAEELAAGFPKTREELFGYRALILGSVEASFFTHDQLDMISDFVSRRGRWSLVPRRPERVRGRRLPGHALGGGPTRLSRRRTEHCGRGPTSTNSSSRLREQVSLTPLHNSERTTARRSLNGGKPSRPSRPSIPSHVSSPVPPAS